MWAPGLNITTPCLIWGAELPVGITTDDEGLPIDIAEDWADFYAHIWTHDGR